MRNGLQIGKVSEQTGLSVDAIRFYEKQCLLERPPRTEGGFRLFGRADIERIRFIRSVQQLGFLFRRFANYSSSSVIMARRVLTSATSYGGNSAQCVGRSGSFAPLERQLVKSLRKCEGNLESKENCQKEQCPVLQKASNGGLHEN